MGNASEDCGWGLIRISTRDTQLVSMTLLLIKGVDV